MLVLIGRVCGLALCWLCPDIHSHTVSAAKEGCIRCPLHIDQRGVRHTAVGLLERLPTWKYHIPVLCGGPVCNCVLSDLQSPSRSFVPGIFLQWIYFSFSGILAVVPLVTKFWFFFSHHVNCKPMIKVCENCTLYVKRTLTPSRKCHIKQLNDWMQQYCISICFLGLYGLCLSVKHFAGIRTAIDL